MLCTEHGDEHLLVTADLILSKIQCQESPHSSTSEAYTPLKDHTIGGNKIKIQKPVLFIRSMKLEKMASRREMNFIRPIIK